MKVTNQYIVYINSKWQILYECKGSFNEYFLTSNGAFNQRDVEIKSISEDEANKILLINNQP